MELLGYPKTEYLLDASLNDLHKEALTWTKELEFCKDEMVFFYNLVHKQEIIKNIPSEELAIIEKELIHLYSETLNSTLTALRGHEKTLSNLLKENVFQNEKDYRETHRDLRSQICDVDKVIKNFKRKVFLFFLTHR